MAVFPPSTDDPAHSSRVNLFLIFGVMAVFAGLGYRIYCYCA